MTAFGQMPCYCARPPKIERELSIALEEMGLPCTTYWINIGKGDQFDPDFLKIAPNNRMPATVDFAGPDGATARERIAVDQWLMWQMGGVGPMAGQNNLFIKYAPSWETLQVSRYTEDRYCS